MIILPHKTQGVTTQTKETMDHANNGLLLLLL